MFYRVLLFFCLSTTITFANTKEAAALTLLENMSQAMKQLDYQGTVAFFKNGRLDTMKYFHTLHNGQEQERLLSLNSPMREVIREAGKVSCVFKKTNELVVNEHPVSQSFIVDLPKDFSTVDNVYSFIELEEESVAMLTAHVISIEPKDQYRYKRKIWLNKENFLPLKSEVYDLAGKTVEQVVFTEIHVSSPVLNDGSFDHKERMSHKKTEIELLSIDQARIDLQNLPLNYHVVFFTLMKDKKVAQATGHILLSDGFSTVSVYIEEKVKDPQEGLQVFGSVKSLTKIIDKFQITVLGEVPVSTVQFIAQGIKLKESLIKSN